MSGSRTLSSLLTGAGTAMVALTTCTLIVMTSAITGAHGIDWRNLALLVACSGVATLFTLSLLHADLGVLYRTLADQARSAEQDAKTDALTGGQNRRAFLEALDRIHARSGRTGPACLAFIDLDHFKRVNDTLGHEAGDEVLRRAFERIRKVVGAGALFRLSGDEFSVLLEGTGLTLAQGVSHDIRRAVQGSYRIGDRACTIGCSIGLVELSPGTTATPSDAMRKADIAMYKAKETRNGVEIFDADLLRDVTRRNDLGERLRQAIASGRGVGTHFQAIVGRDGTPVALEALFRWVDDEWGEIAPDEAVAIAKDFRLLDELSLVVIRTSCRAARALPRLQISINVEASQLFDTAFVSSLEAAVDEHGVESSRFILEIGEGDIAAHGGKIEFVLTALAEAGYTLAVDNFGSSNVSLSFLAGLGVSHVKLDRSQLHNARETGSVAVMRAQVQLARSLGLRVTCEAIGDRADEDIALQSDSEFLQGYRYCLPQPLDAFLVAGAMPLARVA